MAQYNVGFDTTQPIQIVFTATAINAGQKTFSQLITNRDPNSTLLIGFEQNHQPVDFTAPLNTSVVDPLSSIVVDGTMNVWAVAQAAANSSSQTASGTITVDVVPTSLGTSGSPLAIASAVVQSGLAVLIAQQISQSGVPLISPPQLLYNVSAGTSGGTGTGLFGASVKTASGQTPTQAETAWQTIVGRNVKTMKIYQAELAVGNNNDNWVTTATGSITACIALGARACLCYSPTFDVNTGAGTPTAKANMAASISALKAILTGGGAPAPVVTLWQEPQVTRNGFTATTYKACVQYYANTDANGTGVRANAQLFYDGEGFHTDQAASYYPGSSFIDGIAVDYYGSDFFAGTPQNLDTWHQLDTTKPFGIWECGDSAAKGASRRSQSQMQQFLIGPSPAGSVPSVLQELTAILQAGGTIDSFTWYQDDGNTSGANYISSSSDYRVPMLQQINDAITSTAPSPGLAINAGQTVTLTPINPSPGGSYAAAQGISYDITVNAIGSAAPTVPFLIVQLFWKDIDVPGSLSVARQSFMVPVGATGTSGTIINGVGPMTGALLAVKVQNLDTVTNYVNVVMNSTSRQQNAHRWHWDAASSVAVPGYTLANGNATIGILCTGNFTVGAGSSIQRLCSMYTGQIWVRLGNSANFTLTLVEPAQDMSEPYHQGSSSTADNDLLISSPRSPLLMTLGNTGGASNTITVDVIANDPL